jgi:hypothetical protein
MNLKVGSLLASVQQFRNTFELNQTEPEIFETEISYVGCGELLPCPFQLRSLSILLYGEL